MLWSKWVVQRVDLLLGSLPLTLAQKDARSAGVLWKMRGVDFVVQTSTCTTAT